MHGFANFLKHADKDPAAISGAIDESVNDFILPVCCLYYQSLGQKLTPEMKALVAWSMALYPDLLTDDLPQILDTSLKQARIGLLGIPRSEQLAIWKQLLRNKILWDE